MTGELVKNPDPTCQSDLVQQLREFSDEEVVGFAQTNPKEGRFILSLYCRYRSLVESIVISGQSQVMASTVWVQVRRRLNELNPRESKFLNWLTVLSADTLAQVLRGNQKLLTSPSGVNPILLAYLDQVLQQLATPQRFVVVLHDVYQWPLSQIKSWMAEQQWTVTTPQLEAFLKEGQQALLDFLPVDIKNLCLPNADEDALKYALQGLEFDLELERENFKQWYAEQATLQPPAQRIPQAMAWTGGLIGLVILGMVLGWQSLHVLTRSLSNSPSTPSIAVVPTSPPAEPEPEPVGNPPIQPPSPPPLAESVPPTVPIVSKDNQVAKSQSEVPPQQAPPKKKKPQVTSYARVYVIAQDPEKIASLKQDFPGVFPKSCAGSPCFQVGAFRTERKATSLASILRSRGYEVTITATK